MVENNVEALLKQIGSNIKTYRKQKGAGWTQEKLAEQAGINSKHLSDIERGKYNISIAYLCKIANALEVSYRQLLDGQSEDGE